MKRKAEAVALKTQTELKQQKRNSSIEIVSAGRLPHRKALSRLVRRSFLRFRVFLQSGKPAWIIVLLVRAGRGGTTWRIVSSSLHEHSTGREVDQGVRTEDSLGLDVRSPGNTRRGVHDRTRTDSSFRDRPTSVRLCPCKFRLSRNKIPRKAKFSASFVV